MHLVKARRDDGSKGTAAAQLASVERSAERTDLTHAAFTAHERVGQCESFADPSRRVQQDVIGAGESAVRLNYLGKRVCRHGDKDNVGGGTGVTDSACHFDAVNVSGDVGGGLGASCPQEGAHIGGTGDARHGTRHVTSTQDGEGTGLRGCRVTHGALPSS